MTLQRTTMASLATLGLGALATGAALVQAAGFSALLSGFGLLALSPYAVFCGACFLAGSSRGRAIATLVVCALATACAIFFYGDLIFLQSWLDERVGLSLGALLPASRRDPSSGRGVFYPPAQPQQHQRLTMRWSERRTGVRSTFEMTSTPSYRPTRPLIYSRDSFSLWPRVYVAGAQPARSIRPPSLDFMKQFPECATPGASGGSAPSR